MVVTGLLLFAIVFSMSAEDLRYSVDSHGLPVITYYGKKLFKASMPFWGDKWKWAGLSIKADPNNSKHFTGNCNHNLSFSFDLKWGFTQKNSMTGTYVFDVPKAASSAIGGGFEFDLSLKDMKKRFGASDPVLHGKNGWEWQFANGKSIKMIFSPEMADVFFERGNKNRIRCFVYSKSVPAGRKYFKMTISLPEGGKRVLSASERYGKEDHTGWFTNALNPTKSFIDLNYLNHKPAGKFGFIKVSGDKFLLGNGKPIRFWGCNVQAYTLFIKDRKLIKAHAKRIAALGFNLVRLHHLDSQSWVRKCVIKMGNNSQKLYQEALDTYFYWIKCLEDEGIYVWIDLHDGRTFRKGDNIPGFDEIFAKARNKKAGAEVKGYCYVNKRITELMREFNKKLVTTVNPYTKKALKDDPGVMGFLITNENDLTCHFGNALLGDKHVPFHNKLLKKMAEDFAAKTGLNVNQIQQTWLPGVSKLFLNDMEYHWNVKMIKQLREIGVGQPIATCQMWGKDPLFSLPALTAGNMIDVHVYTNGEFLIRDPRGVDNVLDYIARSQVVGMPLTITEWNSEDAANPRDKFVLPIMMGALAAFQGWDAPMLYGYSQDRLTGNKVNEWSAHNIPNIIGAMPAVALMYRRHDVSEAKKTYVAELTKKTLFMTGARQAETAFSTLSLMHKVVVAMPAVKELPWLKKSVIPADAVTFTDLYKNFIPEGRSFVLSDTNQLRRDWRNGVFTINSPRTQAAVGWLKHKGTITLKNVSFRITTPKAAVILTSLDNKPLNTSNKILVTALARIYKKKVGWRQVALSEPVAGYVNLKNSGSSLSLIPLNGDGTKQEVIACGKSAKGIFHITLPTDKKTNWFILRIK